MIIIFDSEFLKKVDKIMVLEFLHRISDKIIEMDVNNHHVRTILTIG